MTLKIAILAAAIATLFSGAAQAGPFGYGPGIAVPGLAVNPMIQPARIVCDAFGRCWRTRPRYIPPVVYMPPLPYYGYGYGHRYHYGHRYRHHRHHYRW